jgi:hypothetical protein
MRVRRKGETGEERRERGRWDVSGQYGRRGSRGD